MSLTFDHSLAAPARHIITYVADRFLETLERSRRYLAVRRTRRKLQELPDWILRDIGISRGEIPHVSSRAHERSIGGADRSWRHLS
jgi:uncharacterized protein YjiS (DUF1127 family)